MDTIFAQATAPGKAGVSVVRISGPNALAGVSRLCDLPPARRPSLRRITNGMGSTLDKGLVLVFDAGASFTGEDVVELQLHGSVAVVSAVLRVLGTLPGFRAADPGEFTRRALDNDRLDLTQVEGLADLIDAETELQRQQAQSVLDGVLSKKVMAWRRDLIEAAALLEATIDFSDEDVPVDVAPDVLLRIDRVSADIDAEIEGFPVAERVRDGFEVAIMGPPNAGKSTLLNRIARRQVALTSDIAGTTRDIIEVRMDLRGLPVTLLDTAGLRDAVDPLEAAGISAARDRSASADIKVWLSLAYGDAPEGMDIVLMAQDDDGVRDGISGATGQGVDLLLEEISERLLGRIPASRLSIRRRHQVAMKAASALLSVGRADAIEGGSPEILAEDLRRAGSELSALIGDVDVDDLLDDIFSRFCIGK